MILSDFESLHQNLRGSPKAAFVSDLLQTLPTRYQIVDVVLFVASTHTLQSHC